MKKKITYFLHKWIYCDKIHINKIIRKKCNYELCFNENCWSCNNSEHDWSVKNCGFMTRWIMLVEFLIMRFYGGFWAFGIFLMKKGESREKLKNPGKNLEFPKHHKPTQNPTTHSSIIKSTFRFLLIILPNGIWRKCQVWLFIETLFATYSNIEFSK